MYSPNMAAALTGFLDSDCKPSRNFGVKCRPSFVFDQLVEEKMRKLVYGAVSVGYD